MERDKKSPFGLGEKERALARSHFPPFLFLSGSRDTRPYSFIIYSVPIACLEIMRYIRTERTNKERGGGRIDINSGLDASLIVRAANDSAISAIADNGGALDEN